MLIPEERNLSGYNPREVESERGGAIWSGRSTAMGILTLFAPTTSVSSIVQLIIYIGVTALTYWALLRIITAAGYSNVWMALPISTMFLTWLCYIIFWSDLHGIYFGGAFSFGFSGFNQVSIPWTLDEISIVLNWLFFLVIAFSGSPIGERFAGSLPSRSAPPAPMNYGAPASTLPPPPDPVTATRPVPPSAAGPVNVVRPMPPSAAGPGGGGAAVPGATAPKRPGAQFCAWCGESLPGNRALFHDCGPKDRPETNCKNCGTSYPAGSTTCASCSGA
jgi:hypothetical protein